MFFLVFHNQHITPRGSLDPSRSNANTVHSECNIHVVGQKMKGTTYPSKSTDRGGVEPQLVSQDVQFELFAPEKLKLDILRRHAHPSPISFGTDELAMLHAIARHAGA